MGVLSDEGHPFGVFDAMLDDISSWTEADVLEKLHSLLPEDCALEVVDTGSMWEGSLVEQLSEGPEDFRIVWVVEDFDKRSVLFRALEKLLPQPELPPGDPWSPSKPRPTQASVSQFVAEKYADPEDVDPDEVASVYGLKP